MSGQKGQQGPFSLKCSQCKKKRDQYDNARAGDLVRTGRVRDQRMSRRPRKIAHECRCLKCGRVGWYTHSRAATLPLEESAKAPLADVVRILARTAVDEFNREQKTNERMGTEMTSSKHNMRSSFAKTLKLMKPDVPEHSEQTVAVQVHRQWYSDCRAVAEALKITGEDEIAFLRECGDGAKTHRPGERLSWTEVNSTLEMLLAKLAVLRVSLPLDAPDLFAQSLSVIGRRLDQHADEAGALSDKAKKKAARKNGPAKTVAVRDRARVR